jgi:hypothetical protein
MSSIRSSLFFEGSFLGAFSFLAEFPKLAEIAEVLGHKTLAMVKRYAHLTEAHTSTVVEKMNRKVFG